jgi:protein required for attachment to host cells
MQIRIIVADQSEARFYDTARRGARLKSAGRLTDPLAHLHDRELKSDRPGRTFNRAAGRGRRGASAHHATGGERSPRKIEAQRFARRIVAELRKSTGKKGVDRLILMAGPSFLGLLRQALPASLRKLVVAEIHRDLVHQTEAEVRSHIPESAFAGEE